MSLSSMQEFFENGAVAQLTERLKDGMSNCTVVTASGSMLHLGTSIDLDETTFGYNEIGTVGF